MCPCVETFTKRQRGLIHLTFSVNHKHEKGAGKSDYSVSDYLGALVGDFIRGKKLQEEEREQREQIESEEILASLLSQRTNVS